MASPANDAHLAQLVRAELGRDPATRDVPLVNVSSCKHVVTLHGDLTADQERAVREAARGVEGVREVVSKLRGRSVFSGGLPGI